MATNLDLEDSLIEEARVAGGHRTKKEAVTAALREYVRQRKQTDILQLFGTVAFDRDYDSARRSSPASGKSGCSNACASACGLSRKSRSPSKSTRKLPDARTSVAPRGSPDRASIS